MRWLFSEQSDLLSAQSLADELGISLAIASLLVQRGIETFDQAKTFFRPSFEQLHDPYLMRDMEAAVERIIEAIGEDQPILVYGDYDVDGTTSVALVAEFLQQHTDKVATYIPDRYEEGYGISYQGIDFAHDNEIPLIIALDCGIKAIEKIDYAKQKGIDFIICDHHRPGDEIPDAIAVLDPKRSDCNYPYKELCGCGIGFKLIQALGQHIGMQEEDFLPYLDLVATAIGADMVPITGENRTLAALGIHRINTHPRAGFKAIVENVKKDEFSLTDLSFIIGPRINAAGRMNHGSQAVELLLATDLVAARKMAAEIEHNNTSRRATELEITEEALKLVKISGEENRETTVVYKPHWHKGVIGIVASRLIERYYRPTLVFTKSGEHLAASARSISGYDIYDAIDACKAHLIQFGGHKYAAGVTIEETQFEAFKAAFENYVSQTLDEELKTPSIKVDLELSFSDITPKFYRIIKQFAPFGQGNASPTFISRGVNDTGYVKTVGDDKSHLKATLVQEDSFAIGCIGFGLGDKLSLLSGQKKADVVYSIDENTWNGKTSLQLILKDIKPVEN